MRYPKTRFGYPTRAPSKRKSATVIFRPTLGLHTGDVPQDLPAGFTPEAQNFVTDGGYLTPRSALSRFGAYSFGRPVLGGAELGAKDGSLNAVASSASTIAFYPASVDSWTPLTYSAGSVSGASLSDAPSGLSTDYWSIANIYDASLDGYLAVLSNGTNWAKWFEVDDSTTTFSDFTWLVTLDEMKAARAVAAINDRLVTFHSVSSNGTVHPTRVAWSARGAPRDWTAGSGAGFEDLVGMRGRGETMVRHQDVLILLTDQEVWVAQPTLDDYAFRFLRITDALGCPYPRTAVSTPLGVMFLASDLEVYVTDGRQVLPVGAFEDGSSRIKQLLEDEMIEGDRAWAAFNRVDRRYELYYTARDTTDGFPTRALYYHLDDQSWLPQRFSHELTFGFDFADPGTSVSWDDLDGVTWDELTQGWDSIGVGEDRRDVVTFGSAGTAYRLRSDNTNDDGSAIDARWRSHGLNQRDQMQQAHLSEIWMDYLAGSASSGTLYTSGDLGASWDAGKALNFDSTRRNIFAPLWRTAQSPMFEIRVGDGGKPKIGRFQATLVDAGRFRGAY